MTRSTSVNPAAVVSRPTNWAASSQPQRGIAWLGAAVELIDAMAQQGGAEQGLQACEQLIRVRDALPGEIYWRAAALASASGRDADQIASLVDKARQTGDLDELRKLPGRSLRGYLAIADRGSLDDVLDRLAARALASKNPTNDYRVIAALLALDNQPSRSKLFAAAAVLERPGVETRSSVVTKLASTGTMSGL